MYVIVCTCVCAQNEFSVTLSIYKHIYTHTFFKSHFKLGESKHFVSCMWSMGRSFNHSLSISQYINKTLVLSVLMESLQVWTDAAGGGLLESVGSLPWTFRSRNFFPVLTFHHIETSLMPCWKAPFSCLCPFLCPVLLELRGNQKCRRKLGRWK